MTIGTSKNLLEKQVAVINKNPHTPFVDKAIVLVRSIGDKENAINEKYLTL